MSLMSYGPALRQVVAASDAVGDKPRSAYPHPLPLLALCSVKLRTLIFSLTSCTLPTTSSVPFPAETRSIARTRKHDIALITHFVSAFVCSDVCQARGVE